MLIQTFATQFFSKISIQILLHGLKMKITLVGLIMRSFTLYFSEGCLLSQFQADCAEVVGTFESNIQVSFDGKELKNPN